MPSAIELKSYLRNSVLARRDALEDALRIELSLQAAHCAVASGPLSPGSLQPGTIVSGFLPIRSEIDPRPLLFDLAQRRARLCLPVVVSDTKIEFREFLRDAPLVPGKFGTLVPGDGAQRLDPQIVILPLSVFDRKGGRIGYGAGYYDRAIARLISKGRPPCVIGLGFSMQEVDSVPMEPHDKPMDAMVTELGFCRFDGQGASKL